MKKCFRFRISCFGFFIIYCLLSSVFCLLPTVCYADFWDKFEDFYSSKDTTCGLAWLKLIPCARGIALGDAYLSVVGGAESVLSNPAGLGKADGLSSVFTHWHHFMGIRYEFLGLSYRSGKNAYGLGVAGLFVGELEHRNEQQELLGSYSVYDFLGVISYARELDEGLWLGGSLKGIYEKIYIYALSSWLLDFGFIYHAYPGLWIGGTLVNLGAYPKFLEEKLKPPRGWRIGANYGGDKLLISCDVNKYIDEVAEAGLGVEYNFTPFFCIRGGYTTGNKSHCVALGFGLLFRGVRLDYAFRPYGLGLGSAHIFTLKR